MFSKEWVPNHATKIKGRLDNYILPYIGARPIKSLAFFLSTRRDNRSG